ncbi:MAG TPA: FtsX-like permease family protein [Candidatus Paceibacterota bacterium]|nr:FtsX-like permease family protein [Candidatus Paceibacterota bacterium]
MFNARTPKKSITFVDLVRLSLRIFKTKPTRTFLTILGMSVGISAVVFLVSLGYGLQYILIGKLVTSQDSLITLSASYPIESGLDISTSTITKISALPNVAEISPVAEFSGVLSVASSTGLVPTIRVAQSDVFRLSGTSPDIGTTIRDGHDDIVLSAQALQLLNEPADASTLNKEVQVEVYLPNPDGTMRDVVIPASFTVVGIISDAQQPPIAIIPASSMPVAISSFREVYVKAKDAASLITLRDTMAQQGFVISANIDLVTQAEKITNVITIILAVFGITALVVSAIGMFNTMLIGFIERTYEVGVMKSIGATDGDVRNLFLMESAVIGVLGGSGGILIGLGVGKLTDAILNFISTQMGGKTFELFILPFWFGAFVFIMSIAIGVIAGFLPARRASKLSPREAFTKR